MPLHGVTILVIDNQLGCDSLSALLRSQDAIPLTATVHEEAKSLFQSQFPDVVLYDWLSASKVSLSFIQELVQLNPLIPIVVMSDTSHSAQVLEAMRAGAWDYLLKPVDDIETLSHTIAHNLKCRDIFQESQRCQRQLEDKNQTLSEALAALEDDQKAGREVQKSFLPKNSHTLLGLEFEYQLIPTLYISGDFVDYFKLPDDKVFFYLADVSGHGSSSAFVTILLKTLVTKMRRDLRRGLDDALSSPIKFLQRLNREVIDLNLGKHLTMIVGVIDNPKKELTYSVAGHLPLPVLTTLSGSQYLSGRGMPVGLFGEAAYTQITTVLSSPFLITLFSDGILEVIHKKSLLEKEQYLLDVLQQPDLTIDDMLHRLQFKAVKHAPDDIAIMTIRGTA